MGTNETVLLDHIVGPPQKLFVLVKQLVPAHGQELKQGLDLYSSTLLPARKYLLLSLLLHIVGDCLVVHASRYYGHLVTNLAK